jgi:hypothetical protein
LLDYLPAVIDDRRFHEPGQEAILAYGKTRAKITPGFRQAQTYKNAANF